MKKLLLLIAIIPSFLTAQHVIKGKFSPPEAFKFAFLYRVTPNTSIFIDNADLKEDGSFKFELDSSKVAGTYRIVYAQPQEQYNFDLLYNTKEDVELIFDMEKGVEFVASEENKLLTSYNKSMNLISSSVSKYYSSTPDNKKGFKKVIKVLKDSQNEFEKASSNTILAKEFIKASKPYIPEDYEDAKTFSKNVKDSFFSALDFNNKTLQNSNFLIENTMNYVYSFIDDQDDNKAFKANIDDVAKAMSNAEPSLKKIIFQILWLQFAEEENEPVSNHISSNYLLELAKNEKDEKLVKSLTAFENSSIGKIAPDFELEVINGKEKIDIKKLSELKDHDHYLVVFWSTTCSHCLEEMPQLRDLTLKAPKQQIQIIAVALDNDIYRWKDQTYEYPKFHHVFGEGKWENKVGNDYNVTATPAYFILDADKKIIKKPYDFEGFKEWFDDLPKYGAEPLTYPEDSDSKNKESEDKMDKEDKSEKKEN